jgi:hypothetical protein
MSKRDQILNVFKPSVSLNKGDIARASGVDPGMAGYYLKQLVDDGKLTASGSTGDRKWTLSEAGAADKPEHEKASKPPKTGKKRHYKKRATAAPERTPRSTNGKAATPGASNVTDFLAAMTDDRRMVLVGGDEPLIFSPAQTQHIADLMFSNFEAA